MSAALIVAALASAEARLSLVKDINPPGEEGSAPRNLTGFHGALFFSADDGVHGERALEVGRDARWDEAGQGHIPGGGGVSAHLGAQRRQGERGRRDAVLQGPRRPPRLGALEVGRDARRDEARKGLRPTTTRSWLTKGPGGRLFFFAAATRLWKSDGTRSGTKLVKKMTYGPFRV